MVWRSQLASFLLTEIEPTAALCGKAVERVSQDSEEIRSLTEDPVRGDLLVQFPTNYDRFENFFHRLHSALAKQQQQVTEIAQATSVLLRDLLRDLYQLMRNKPEELVRVLVPAFQVCLLPPQPRGLPELALVLDDCEKLLEYFLTHPTGALVIRCWAEIGSTVALGIDSQILWTNKMASMISSCSADHKLGLTVQRWPKMQKLRNVLRELQAEPLKQENKKAAKAYAKESRSLRLDDDFKKLLAAFNLPAPQSQRMAQRHLTVISNKIMPDFLRPMIQSFPCKACVPGSRFAYSQEDAETAEEPLQEISNLHLNMFGKSSTEWKIVISEPVLKDLKAIGKNDSFEAIQETLFELGSGDFSRKRLAVSKEDTGRLLVPLYCTDYGENVSILWQVSVGSTDDLQGSAQMLTVWAFGDSSAISRGIGHAAHIQRGYSEDTIRRCHQRPTIAKGISYPLIFNFKHEDQQQPRMLPSDLDVRLIDPIITAMGNKFYSLTEPVIQSIIDNELTAAFPFDLSRDEARCIIHFQSASLILGRSGTGKTTCLIFKLVGKYLASQAILDEKAVRQVSKRETPDDHSLIID